MTKNSISIAAVLNERRSDIFDLIAANKINDAKALVNELLDSEKLKTNASVPEAKMILNSKKNWNAYLSTLMTYMTCMKVS